MQPLWFKKGGSGGHPKLRALCALPAQLGNEAADERGRGETV